MIDFGPDRLGHCCYLTEAQLEQVHKLNIPVEICPTSNLAVMPQAGNLVGHLPHLKKLLELNHNFVICTDDTMLFSTNISTELFEFAKGFKVSTEDLKALLVRNVDAIFDESCKEEIRAQIEKYRV
jgi:adenosine deaminase